MATSNHIGDFEPTRGSRPRVGLVLGGGGAVGAAYHAGALAALEHDLGWDARDADVIVGTSAGSMVGAQLRLGAPASDLAALIVGIPALSASDSLATWMMQRPALAPFTTSLLLRVPRLPRPSMLFGLARVAAAQRALPVGGLSMFLPDGRETLAPHLGFLDGFTHGEWPEKPLLVCAVRRRDWRLTAFDANASGVTLQSLSRR